MSEEVRTAVIGDGGWGTAIAMVADSAGCAVRLWGHDPEYLEEMRSTRRNRMFLPGVELPVRLGFQPDINALADWADLIISVVPGKFLGSVYARLAGASFKDKLFLSLTKGMDPERHVLPSELIREAVGNNVEIAVLSGPSHAEEVSRFLPASVVVAAPRIETARRIQRVISTSRFRIYASSDTVGVELAGAMKNVIAIAAGMAHGMGLGDNALAALATRGLAEMTRLGLKLGAKPATFSGLAGMGDLITTCASPHSRNRQVGGRLAKGEGLDAILAGMSGIPEGVTTASQILLLAEKHGVDMPITRQVAEIVFKGRNLYDSLDFLMNRERKDEECFTENAPIHCDSPDRARSTSALE